MVRSIDISIPSAAVVVQTSVFDDLAPLFEDETRAISGACEARIQEFSVGRNCAHRALQQLGVPSVPILRGEKREPLWPEGIVGSITHCKGFCAAAVAFECEISSIGIDAEPNHPLPNSVLNLISVSDERHALQYRSAFAFDDVCEDRLLFSAKESVYKAWFPLCRSWVGFDQVSICFDRERHTFSVESTVVDPRTGVRLSDFRGAYAFNQELLFTWVVVNPKNSAHTC